MTDLVTIPASELLPVQSRVSWGAIFAGAVVALATYFLLTLLGAAIGLAVGDDVRTNSLGTGAAIWAILATALALFAGGWVVSQCVAGENKREAVIYGIILWGVVFAMILWLVASGVRAGFGTMIGVANAAGSAASDTDWESAAQRAGIPSDRIAEWRRSAADAPAQVRAAANDPANREAVRDNAAQVAWWTLLGTVLSMAAAVIGAVVGAGPSFRLLAATPDHAGTRHRDPTAPAARM